MPTELEKYIMQEFRKAEDELLLTEVMCGWCGLPRLMDWRDHHICKLNPNQNLRGLAAFVD